MVRAQGTPNTGGTRPRPELVPMKILLEAHRNTSMNSDFAPLCA